MEGETAGRIPRDQRRFFPFSVALPLCRWVVDLLNVIPPYAGGPWFLGLLFLFHSYPPLLEESRFFRVDLSAARWLRRVVDSHGFFLGPRKFSGCPPLRSKGRQQLPSGPWGGRKLFFWDDTAILQQ